jgi:hypothetical protein
MAAALPAEAAEADPQIRASDHADFQANGVLPVELELQLHRHLADIEAELLEEGAGGAQRSLPAARGVRG